MIISSNQSKNININDILPLLDERHRASLEHAMQVLSSNKDIVEEAYLYGSVARLEHKYSSDVDIIIFTRSDIPANKIRALKIAAIPDDYNLPEVDIHAYHEGVLAENHTYYNNVRKDGIKI